jgi:hypothetical protein
MIQAFYRFFLRILILTVILGALGLMLQRVLPPGAMTPLLFPLLALFLSITLTVHYVLLRITLLSPRKFVTYFMLVTFAKLVVYFMAVLIYLFTKPPGIIPFVVTFLIFYLIYTVFEVVYILIQTKE